MRLSVTQIKQLCEEKGRSLSKVLSDAGVSRTAYYSLSRKQSLLPKSLHTLAAELDVTVGSLVFAEQSEIEKLRHKQQVLNVILVHQPDVDRNNAWHTLLSLDKKPLKRLEMSLLRGRKINISK